MFYKVYSCEQLLILNEIFKIASRHAELLYIFICCQFHVNYNNYNLILQPKCIIISNQKSLLSSIQKTICSWLTLIKNFVDVSNLLSISFRIIVVDQLFFGPSPLDKRFRWPE